MANPNSARGKKRLLPKQQQLEQRRGAGDRHTVRNGCIPLTYPAWEEKAKKPKYGGYTPAQAAEKWQEWQKDKRIGRDEKGVVAGQDGHERLWCPILEQRLKDDFEEMRRDHVSLSKPVKRLNATDRNEFLAGQATLSEEEEPDMSQGEEFETRPAKRPRLLNPGSDARSSVGSIAPGTVSSSATTLVPGPKAKAKGKAKGKTIAKQWERSVAVHEATQTVEKLFKDMEETLQTAKNDLASARELAFGKDEDPVKLEQFRPYEMVVTRKCAWLAYIEAGIGLEHARAVAVEGGASTEEGPVANWDSVCSLAEIKQSTESAIAQATGPLEISDAVTKAKAETKKFKGTIRDAKASITKLQKASAPIVVKAKSQAAASPLVHQTAKLETSPSVSKGRPRQSPLLLRTQLPPDKEIKRVVVQGGALPEELQELLKGGAPLVVQTRESVDALVQTREFSVCYHAFKRDFELDKEKSGNFAASRKFRMLPFGSAGCRAAADVLDKYTPPWALRLGDSEIEDNCAAKFHVSAKQYMSDQGISLHAMMKNDHYIGREWLGFPSIRMHTAGFRIVLIFKIADMVEVLAQSQAVPAAGSQTCMEPRMPSSWQHDPTADAFSAISPNPHGDLLIA